MTVKSIAIYMPDLSGGGAERLQVNLARYFLEHGWGVDFVLDRAEGPLLSAAPGEAHVVDLGSARTIHSVFKLARYLRERRPGILLSSLGHNNIIALAARILSGTQTRVIVSQHNLLSAEMRKSVKYRILPALYRLLLPAAFKMVAVSRGIASDFARHTGQKTENIAVIYNGVVTPDFGQRSQEPLNHPWFGGDIPVFVAVGRLVEQKNFPLLLRAFALLAAKRPARLVILGEGPLRPQLEALAAQPGLKDKVDLAGFQSNPLPFMRGASALVLSSNYEGFAIVLAEALACGTPVVSTDCPHGPAEILENGKYGLLVPAGDAEALARAMAEALDHPPPRDMLRARGHEFSIEACGAQYLELFASARG